MDEIQDVPVYSGANPCFIPSIIQWGLFIEQL